MKFKLTNGTNLELLTESSLNRIINGHDANGYIMMSASRYDAVNKEEPSQQEIWDENNRRTNNLKTEIRAKGYSFIPVYGGYKDSNSNIASIEKSLIVFPYNNNTKTYTDFKVFERDLKSLGERYGQDSILIKRPYENPFYYYYKDNRDGEPFNAVSINDVQRQYFTALKGYRDTSRKDDKKWNSSPQRFSYEYTESYINESPQSIMSAHSRSISGELLDMSNFRK